MKITAGVDVDIWCTKCKTNSVATIVAMVGSEIAQVTCKICGSGPKKYRPAKGKPAVGAAPKAEAASRASKSSGAAKTATAKAPRKSTKKDPTAIAMAADLALWQARRGEIDDKPAPYDISRTYQIGEPMRHPKYGLGFVEAVKGADRMQVLFEEGRKLLVMAYKR